MGLGTSFLRKPVTKKISSDGENERMRYGVSDMQGWRLTQEDAHNCILDFDKNTSIFAVYDGHGGADVAIYCSQKLPEFLKETEAYKKGDYKTALIDAFMGFDATIRTDEVLAILKKINDDEKDVESEDDEDIVNLYEEASMPIEEVIEKYQTKFKPKTKKLLGECSNSSSPSSSGASSSKTEQTTESSDSSCSEAKANSSSDVNVVSSTSSDTSCNESVSTTTNNGSNVNNEAQNEAHCKKTNPDIKSDEVESEIKIVKVESTDMKIANENEINLKVEIESKSSEANGETREDACSSSVPQENGEISPSSKAKGKALAKNVVVEKKSEVTSSNKNLRARNLELYSKLLKEMEEEESDSEDENDTTFEGVVSSTDSDDECEEGESNKLEVEEDDDEEEEGDDDEDNEEDDEEHYHVHEAISDNPGLDSGCTAVVALLHGKELYVANAGDSRCFVCRNGQAIEMSVDHKPEDVPEKTRIIKAGGEIDDGRINGGLNLSRAIGDFTYKKNKELSDREQMIIALPDVRTLTINPAEDEFMVVACDGISNAMTNQEVVDFVRTRIGSEKLSKICEEMFDHCLAPNTWGDGTGCDNMTAVIVQFKREAQKRAVSEEPEESTAKRPKPDGN